MSSQTSHQFSRWETGQDGFDKLALSTSTPLPAPGPGEVLVKIHTVSLNYRDTEVVMGLYNHHQKTLGSEKATAARLVPCSDMCGVVASKGPEDASNSSSSSSAWSVGDRVLSIFNQTHLKGQVTAQDMASGLGLPLPGVLCGYRVFPAQGLVRAPAYLSDEEACALPIAGLTAWMALNGMRPLGQPGGAGETVLIQGTGGVAVLGLLIAKASGATVIITSSTDSKLQRAKSLGADHVINYRTDPSWEQTVMSITAQKGANIIFENGGARTLRQSFDCIAFGGLINCIGYLSGKEDDPGDRTNTNVLALRRNVTLKGLLNGPKHRFEEMLAFFEKHEIKPVVDRVFEFQDANEAFGYLFQGGHFGKVVIRVSLNQYH